ncbi:MULTISPECIES: ABC transporter substrate-binding protein [unclassified Undibacterium]|uniref:ABC transporter substrate-binding protein n=1 Tax=unclassified Undibacterium TaxID=2630295 RepID=UPI002AC981E2|nr:MULTISPECIES: ABC transporter substrate-binding protein [unclassified Undibacterium]MEB0139076.1 ABC transporter substrate-binding protein [Undibacterium sp. CCC2.1]MEB0172967.1 ABC transporter substrate-binding protein [Undibacterium sp. CCC1.1]MEB0177289.1 ABC transporter substrate-binding protein [Undibacterium sp. CCC3.4]MEB0215885.1 ABC transporter substrate-binding protein [Undibacterium sp. 5I2]WPX42087.1 ABC transporter substrate-binding protein [Undibacterium sp. CCC3.4]
MSPYQRIACLSTEAVEVMYALGLEDLVVGISGYTTRPVRARAEKPKISGFSSAKIERILAVQPDLVIAYSNMQAAVCAELVAAGVEVHAYNQRDVAGIFRMISSLACLLDKRIEGQQLCAALRAKISMVEQQSSAWTRRPKIYFEEWNEPLMAGIGWVSDLIELAGGTDVFADLAVHHSAKQRIIADPLEVVRRAPDIIIGSWCGKKFQPAALAARPGWSAIPALRNACVFEIKSADILSPGPAAIEHGLLAIHALIADWQAQNC